MSFWTNVPYIRSQATTPSVPKRLAQPAILQKHIHLLFASSLKYQHPFIFFIHLLHLPGSLSSPPRPLSPRRLRVLPSTSLSSPPPPPPRRPDPVAERPDPGAATQDPLAERPDLGRRRGIRGRRGRIRGAHEIRWRQGHCAMALAMPLRHLLATPRPSRPIAGRSTSVTRNRAPWSMLVPPRHGFPLHRDGCLRSVVSVRFHRRVRPGIWDLIWDFGFDLGFACNILKIIGLSCKVVF